MDDRTNERPRMSIDPNSPFAPEHTGKKSPEGGIEIVKRRQQEGSENMAKARQDMFAYQVRRAREELFSIGGQQTPGSEPGSKSVSIDLLRSAFGQLNEQDQKALAPLRKTFGKTDRYTPKDLRQLLGDLKEESPAAYIRLIEKYGKSEQT